MLRVEGSPNLDGVILAIRIGVGLMMLVHGLPKLERLFSPAPVEFVSVLGMGAGLSLALAVFAEVACSLFLLFGLGTRLAVIPLIITMVIAVFYIHSDDPFARQELGLLYLLFYILLLVAGSGKYSADFLIQRYNRPSGE